MAKAILWGIALGLCLLSATSNAEAQVTPTAGHPPPDDTPVVRVGGTLFLEYIRNIAPDIIDANGNPVTLSAFNVTRAYINVTGQLNHLIAFRVTPDITRETGTGSSLAGSLTLRLKYGYGQFNLDDWIWRGSYVRFGMTQTPYIDFAESIYRYRFQGTLFEEREGFMTSSDSGVVFRTQSPNGLVEVMGGFYNGDGYTRADANDQKAFQVRGTVRPFPAPGVKRGLRLTLFWDDDAYVQDSERRRLVTMTTFEHRFVTAGWTYLNATDQPTLAVDNVDSSGQSFWVVPRFPHGTIPPSAPAGQVRASLEGLFRYDRLNPNTTTDNLKERWIAGVAYWPRMVTSSVSSAILLDYEQVRYRQFIPTRPAEKRVGVHALIAF